MKDYNVLINPKVNDIQTNMLQHPKLNIQENNTHVEYAYEDKWKKGVVKFGSILLSELTRNEVQASTEKREVNYFISAFTCTEDLIINYKADFEDKFIVLLFFSTTIDIQCSSPNQSVKISAGRHIAYFSNDVSHQVFFSATSEVKALSIYIPADVLQSLISNDQSSGFGGFLNSKHSIFETFPMNRFAEAVFLKTESFDVDSFFGQLHFQKDVLALIIEALSYFKNKKSKTFSNNEIEKLKLIEETLIKNLNMSPPSMTKLSQIAAMSQSKLRKLFKAYFGESIYSYFLTHRMKLAHQMLTENKMNIKDVASRLGYKNHSHFSRLFKSKFGKYPSQL